MEATNPYQTPTGDLTTASEIEEGVVKFFSPSCRIGRLRYLAHSMLLTLVAYAVILPLTLLAATFQDMAVLFFAVMGIGYVALLAAIWIIVVQRLHDLNQSGWLSLLNLVPLVNIFLAIYLLFWPGTEGTNNYGANPPQNKRWHWLVGLSMPAIAIIGIIAAILIPMFAGTAPM